MKTVHETMTDYEIYIFILCFIVFAMFTIVFTFMIKEIAKMRLKLIRHGLEDEEIKNEYHRNKRKGCAGTVLGKIVSLLLCLALCAAFVFSAYMNLTEEKAPNGIPSLKVVMSDSMAKKNEKNTYLFENGLNDQLQTFDIIVTHHLPAEEDLELYDIVVYKQDDLFVIHRIVGIEKPNEQHPNAWHFLLQGDAVETPDRFPVLYEQMQGIYEGERVPFVGSFVLFMQSPAGWLCILLVLFAMIATPIVEKKLISEINQRIAVMKEEDSLGDEDSEHISV